jgi:ribose transport system ATP-binding protein
MESNDMSGPVRSGDRAAERHDLAVADVPVTNRAPGLEMRGVSKAFLGVQALKDVSLTCAVGEIHALVGENGAGKSTLIKIASGALRADTGTVMIGGKSMTSTSPVHARRLGLLTAYQDTSLVLDLTVAENLLLSYHGIQEPLPWIARTSFAARSLSSFDLPFGPGDRVADLSPASRQLLEVVRCLVHRPPVLLLDEPTAALDLTSSARLEELLRAAREHSAILYISHRLGEVRRLADRVTVIRDGEIQGTWEGSGWDMDEIVNKMVGIPTELAFPKKGVPSDEMTLSLAEYRGDGFGPIDLHVDAGEIVGIAGSEGNGQRELLRTLAGLRRGSGNVEIDGKRVTIQSPSSAIASGISFQSGDRAAESVFAELSVMDNTNLAVKKELGPIGLVLRSRERAVFEPVARSLGVAHASPDQPIRELSGGNQQKVVITRGILRPTKVLVLDEPTQGVDVNARLDIYRVVAAEAATGTAVIVNSSDSAELEGLCHRVYVLSRGKVVNELSGAEVTEAAIVESFVTGADKRKLVDVGAAAGKISALWGRLAATSGLPLAVLVLLTVLVGIYAESKSSVFLSASNLTSLLLVALPLGIVAIGQQAALLASEFDIAVGSTMSLTVVLLSFFATGSSLVSTIPGLLAVLAVGVLIGLGHAFIVRVLKVSAIIGTIATLSIISGLAIILRPAPGGIISSGLTSTLNAQVGFIPVFFIVLVVAAVLADLWRVRTTSGLTYRATGLMEESSRRSGATVNRIKVTAYVTCAVLAVVAGIFLSVQVGIGSNAVGAGFPLLAFTACFLGGASITGGKGSFFGALLGAVFLTMLTNITPLVNINTAVAQTVTGALTILAVAAYSIQFGGRRRRSTPNEPHATSDIELSGGAQ